MAIDPLKVAVWRFEQIAPLLDPCLDKTQRSVLIDRMASHPVFRPSGREAPIKRSSLYAWLKRYRTQPTIDSLLPKGKKQRKHSSCLPRPWIEYALSLSEELPSRSLFLLCTKIQLKFGLCRKPAKTSLYRALIKESRYQAVCGKRKHKRRTHFVASKIHQIWQGDAKGPFTVKFTDGSERKVTIMSILDDRSRYVLRAIVVDSESLAAVSRAFCDSALRYGLPDSFYPDRHSAYDSDVLRRALALMGIRRIAGKARNPEARGKIESYHKILIAWFINELRFQSIVDLKHLQALLDAFIEVMYNQHYHRELKCSPKEAFKETISQRRLSCDRIIQSFYKQSRQLPHRKTGTIRADGTMWKVPDQYLLPRRHLLIGKNVLETGNVFLIVETNRHIALKPAWRVIEPDTNLKKSTSTNAYPAGSLSPLLEAYRGRKLPQAEPGFGLPEIYECLARVSQRTVPHTQHEAALISQWAKQYGPFHPDSFNSAIDHAIKRIGNGRSMSQLLDELTKMITPTPRKGDSL